MSAPAIPAARAADPGAGATRPAARRTPDAAPDTFGALLAGHGRAPARVRTAAGQPPAKPEVDSTQNGPGAQAGRSPQTGRSPHRSVAARGRSASPAGDDTAEHDRTDATTPSTVATDAAPAVTTAAQNLGLAVAPATPEGAAAGATALAAVPSAPAAAATEPGSASVPSTPTDGRTHGRVPATSATGAATTAAPGTPVPGAAAPVAPIATARPVTATAAVTAPTAAAAQVVGAGIGASGAHRTAARDGDPVTPASFDASSAPVLPVAPFSVPATVVTPPTTGPTASAPPVPAPPVPAQVLAAVSPLLRGDDGSYAVQLPAAPARPRRRPGDGRRAPRGDLGPAAHPRRRGAGRAAGRAGGPAPPAGGAGLRTGSMEVGSGGPQQHREDARRPPVGIAVPGTRTVAARPGPATGGATTALDLRM